MRNKISHGYDSISDEVVWDTVATDIPVLLAKIAELLRLE
ncbi:MAG: HepT-like ribonuclease domain-containing protein [Thermomicrobiales bacterium]